MTHKGKIAVITSVNLATNAALSMAMAHSTQAIGQSSYDNKSEHPRSSSVMQVNTNEFEASFLKVSASCKVSHAAFDAVSVGVENISPEVLSIHAEIERA